MQIVAVASCALRWPIASGGAARGRTERAAILVEVRSAGDPPDEPPDARPGDRPDARPGDRQGHPLDHAERPTRVIGLGEAAPLPGMSIDVLEDAARAIAALAARVPFDVDDCDHAGLIAHELAGAPAARFAVETAVLDALARDAGVSIAALLQRDHAALAPRIPRRRWAAPPIAPVPVAAVVDDAAAARRAFTAGVRCLKIKLGADDDLDRVFQIAAAAPGARLRIDGNATWRRRDVAGRLAALAALPIDYVEEPCQAAHELLAGPLPCKLALDESLGGLMMTELRVALASPGLAALVLKPTLLGGFTPALVLAGLARQHGVAATISHGLEGPIGTAACAELALALGGTGPAGLAAHGGLTGWQLAVPQLAADHVHAAYAPGLGFRDLDLATAAAACAARVADGRSPR